MRRPMAHLMPPQHPDVSPVAQATPLTRRGVGSQVVYKASKHRHLARCTRTLGVGMRALVTGGAGFLGSHLCDLLVARGDHVVCLDNLSSGRRANVAHLVKPGFEFIEGDVRAEIVRSGDFDVVAHLASPASPPDYLSRPLDTMTTASQ